MGMGGKDKEDEAASDTVVQAGRDREDEATAAAAEAALQDVETPRQHCSGKRHRIPHDPQLLRSDVTATHRFWQHCRRRPSDSLALHTHGLVQHPASLWFFSPAATLFSQGDDDNDNGFVAFGFPEVAADVWRIDTK
ncbi:unnamed protein product [Cuscuta campestris]|uniref:Uncharacterized protein n=1 Tax=Cuscuta campestris TaxID=132261 RepID=A0A484L7Z0_9ASTE|nr:unnamed protein product [Cuscuta campestris]